MEYLVSLCCERQLRNESRPSAQFEVGTDGQPQSRIDQAYSDFGNVGGADSLDHSHLGVDLTRDNRKSHNRALKRLYYVRTSVVGKRLCRTRNGFGV